MNKPNISDVEYETQIDHLTRSEAMIAVDAAKTMSDTAAYFFGEQWGRLIQFWYRDMQSIEEEQEIFNALYPIFVDFFTDDFPSLTFDGGSIDWHGVARVVRKIAKHILDEVYDVVEIM